MIDFTQDTDWFITANYFARRINENDENAVNLFYDECQLSGVSFTSVDDGVFAQILYAGLIDKRSQQLAGILSIECTGDNSVAKLKMFLRDECQLPTLVIKELLIWVVDYAFYCLNCSQLLVVTDQHCNTLVTMLGMLNFNVTGQLPTTPDNVTDLKAGSGLYFLNEQQWLNHGITDGAVLNSLEADNYLQNIVKPYFKTAISKPLYSTIIDFRYRTILVTDQSARSIGLSIGKEAIGTGYNYYSRVDLAHWYFGKWYNDKNANVIHHYARKIFRIQQYVFKTGHPASFIDSLPYDRGIRSYLMTFIPVFNETGNVVAIQSLALNYRLAGYHEYIQNLLEQKKSLVEIPQIKLSKREEEVLFLLICGITQEQIAEILEVKRETIAAIIRNQLRIKFSLPNANTKLVVETALSYGFPFSIPESLWRPSVIVLEERLAAWLKQYHSVV